MTLRRQLAVRYSAIVILCLTILGWLTHHEFVEEPAMFRALGIKEPASAEITELVEVLIFAGVPVIFIVGWWLVRHSLKPINELAAAVEQFNVNNLAQRLPRTQNGDEVDRMAAAFNVMAQKLERSVGQIHEFTLRASHELKTPLTVMRAQLETALREASPPAEAQRAALESLLEETQRLARIVDGLTLLSKADAGIITLQREPVPLAELVREAAEDAEVLAQPGNIRVRLLCCEPGVVLGDRHRLRQVLLNLVDNATKYNLPGGHVALSLHQEGDWMKLAVANTGAGVSPELLPDVFERFVRGPASLVQAPESCGLGLTITKWIVEAHGGQIQIVSEPDTLTTVTVRLPVASR